MSARDDYPDLAHAAEWGASNERDALDEIDQLRSDLAAMTEVAAQAIALATGVAS